MAAYFAQGIEDGRLDYAQVIAKWPTYKDAIDTILVADGRQDLIAA